MKIIILILSSIILFGCSKEQQIPKDNTIHLTISMKAGHNLLWNTKDCDNNNYNGANILFGTDIELDTTMVMKSNSWVGVIIDPPNISESFSVNIKVWQNGVLQNNFNKTTTVNFKYDIK